MSLNNASSFLNDCIYSPDVDENINISEEMLVKNSQKSDFKFID